jgi:hypothetical protein
MTLLFLHAGHLQAGLRLHDDRYDRMAFWYNDVDGIRPRGTLQVILRPRL